MCKVAQQKIADRRMRYVFGPVPALNGMIQSSLLRPIWSIDRLLMGSGIDSCTNQKPTALYVYSYSLGPPTTKSNQEEALEALFSLRSVASAFGGSPRVQWKTSEHLQISLHLLHRRQLKTRYPIHSKFFQRIERIRVAGSSIYSQPRTHRSPIWDRGLTTPLDICY